MFGSSLFLGVENMGEQAEKLTYEYSADAQKRAEVDDRSRDLSDESVLRLGLGVIGIASALALDASSQRQKKDLKTRQLASEVESVVLQARSDELVLQGLYRNIRNNISQMDIDSESHPHAMEPTITVQGERT